MKVGGKLLSGPADETVAGSDGPGGGAETECCQQMSAGRNQVANLGTRQWLVTQIMIAFDQFVPERGISEFIATRFAF